MQTVEKLPYRAPPLALVSSQGKPEYYNSLNCNAIRGAPSGQKSVEKMKMRLHELYDHSFSRV